MMAGRRAMRIWTAATIGCGLIFGGFGLPAMRAVEKDAAPATKNGAAAVPADPEAAAAEARVKEAIGLLSADAMEGRGPGTAGLDKAAEFVAGEFKKIGLKTDVTGGAPYQKFTMTVDSALGKKNELTIVGPPGPDGAPKRVTLKLGTDYTPMSFGGSGKLDVPIVFAGYGISSKEDKYDDFEGIDVKGKCLIVFRHEPQQGNPHGAFKGTETTLHAPFTRKLSNAFEHGAAAVIFVTNGVEIENRLGIRRKLWQEAVDSLVETRTKFKDLKKPSDEESSEYRKKVEESARQILDQGKKLEEERDPLLPFKSPVGVSDGSRLPALHARREVINKLLAEAKQPTLDELEEKIDEKPSPNSFELSGWRIEGEVDVERKEAEVKNIVGVLEGSGPHADETIVIGAHYDHLGYGGEGSFVPNVKEIHNGADDNASGTTALLETARLLAAQKEKLGRRVVFIAFTAEEKGLIGSARYCKEPLFALEKTVAMLNMDMVGRLTDDKLIIQGGDTAKEFTKILDTLNTERFHFKLTHNSGGFGPSDHASFYGKKIPVLHFFTGLHNDYHRPTDDADKVNAAGLSRVAQMVSDTALAISEMPERPTYVEVKPSQPAGARGGDRPYFGSQPDFSHSGPGYGIAGVGKDTPAAKAGVQAGDVLIKLGDSNVNNLEDFDSALRKYKAGDKVPIVVKRAGKDVKLTITLGAPR
jgi:hypothetical protein